ncbi:MAG: DUF1761 domain-containing protein [Bacteroidales bacterium]|nr:DUF1761 domain-containing protein [Bacteroidales bacterium]
MTSINLLAVCVAAIIAFVLGFLFHGPVAGKLWMKLANIHPTGNEKFKDMIPQMLWNLLAQFVTAFVLAVILLFASSSPYIGGKGILGGIILAIWLWLGFLVTSSSIEVIWMGRNYKLWLFEVVNSFIVMVAMGAIIAGW